MNNFKPGDWVRYKTCGKWMTGKVSHVGPRGYGELYVEEEDIIVNIEDKRDYFFDDSKYIELWQPKPDEWCWFWDEQYTTAILAKFLEKTDEGYFEHHGNSFEYCEPFIGTLPSHLKNNK